MHETKWRPPTWRDALLADGTITADENPLVPCECGRRQSADMMLDLRPLPPTVRTLFGGPRDFACDGCVGRVRRAGNLVGPALAEAYGAPAQHLTALEQSAGGESV